MANNCIYDNFIFIIYDDKLLATIYLSDNCDFDCMNYLLNIRYEDETKKDEVLSIIYDTFKNGKIIVEELNEMPRELFSNKRGVKALKPYLVCVDNSIYHFNKNGEKELDAGIAGNYWHDSFIASYFDEDYFCNEDIDIIKVIN